jgi:hypothetical protein
MFAARRILATLLATLALALVALPASADPSATEHRQQLRAPTTVNGAIPSGENFYDYCPNGNCLRGDVSADVYGVEVYSDTSAETLYYYGRGKAHIEWGAKRLLAYYVRLYAITSGGTYLRLAANETDRYDVGGAVGLRTPNVNLDTAPCDLRVKFGLGIRWNDGSFGKRGAWSDIFTNYDNPNCA